MSDCIDTTAPPRPSTWVFRVVQWSSRQIAAAFWAIFHARERAAQRQLLAKLDMRMLKDIGLNRADIDQECRKLFWEP